MASKTRSIRARKSKTSTRTAQVIQIDSERRKEYEFNKWEQQVEEFLALLSEDEVELVKKPWDFIVTNPKRKTSPESSDVIQFKPRSKV